jgi:hypothetical protein
MRLVLTTACIGLAWTLPLRAACTLDGATVVQLPSSTTPTITLTTTAANSEICYFSAAYAATAPSIIGVAGGGVTFARRFTHLESVLFGGGFAGKTEMWCGLSATLQAGTTFTATYDLAISNQSLGLIFGINGVNTAAPFDVNVSLPGYAHDIPGTSIAQITGISTTSANGFLVSLCTQWNFAVGCNVNASGWTNIAAHQFSSTVSMKGQYKTVLAPQSSVVIPTLGTSIPAWTGNADAFDCGGTAGGVGPVFFRQTPWMMGR